MHILFNFEIFSINHWIRASHAHLRGIGGFTFGIITLAALPLYIATTIVVARNQKPLFSIPVPTFISNAFKKLFSIKTTEPEQETDKTENESVTEASNEQPNEKLRHIPAELRAAFIRAESHPNRINTPICNVCSTTPNIYPSPASNKPTEPTQPEDFPLPPDFGSDYDFGQPSEPSAPIFKDIDFYSTNNDSESNAINGDFSDLDEDPIIKHLLATQQTFTLEDPDIILTNKHAIVSHIDDDFWIMDDPTWFAAGQTRESPIPKLLQIANERHLEPVLYLGAQNIMNLESKQKEWESMGIRIITQPDNL